MGVIDSQPDVVIGFRLGSFIGVVYCWMGLWLVGMLDVQGEEGNVDVVVGGGTLMEGVREARDAFAAGEMEVAAAGFGQLWVDFGGNDEALPVLQANQGLYALALVRSGRFEEALPEIEASLEYPGLALPARDELAFFRGLIYFQERRMEEARLALVAYFQEVRFDRVRRFEALMMAGQTHLAAGEYLEAGRYFRQVRERLMEVDIGIAMRAGVSELCAMVRQGEERLGEVRELIGAMHGSMDAVESLIGYQNLVLQAGALWLELGLGGEGDEAAADYRSAIAVLQGVWSRDRLLRHQGAVIEALEREVVKAALYPERHNELLYLNMRLGEVRRDYEGLLAREDFDAVVRFRMAMAFMRLERFREAGMLLQGMLQELPVGELVEQAALPLLQCWFQEGRWEKVVECAELYEARFAGVGKGGMASHGQVLLLKALAFENDARYWDAVGVCERVVEEFAGEVYAERAWFQWAYLLLLLDESEQARWMFAGMGERFPDSELLAGASYWEGEALALMGEYDEARGHLAGFLEKVGKGEFGGEYVDAAEFRRAYCTFAAGRYGDAIGEMGLFLQMYPGSSHVSEALLLRGDALFGEGLIEEGMASYAAIGREAGAIWEEARFKMGNALRLGGKFEALRGHFEEFIEEAPGSVRVAEALHWMMWSFRQEGDEARALVMGVDAFERLAGDPAQVAVEDISWELVRLIVRAEELRRVEFVGRLERMVAAAGEDVGSRTRALRAIWTLAALEGLGDPEGGRVVLMRGVEYIEYAEQNPRLLVDIADVLREEGYVRQADEIYRETRRWHPRTIERGRILIGRGMVAEVEGEMQAALEYYEQLEDHTLGVAVGDLGLARLTRARLYVELGDVDAGHALLMEIQGDMEMSARVRAQAFLDAGLLWEALGEAVKAAACYERVYVAYEGFVGLAAEAYGRRAGVLESLGMHRQAEEVRAEMLRMAEASGDFGVWERWLAGGGGGEVVEEGNALLDKGGEL